MSEKLRIKDGIIGRLYRPNGRQIIELYQINTNGGIVTHSIATDDDEVMMLLGLKTMLTSWKLARVMLSDGTTGYVQQYIEVVEHATS